MRFLLRTLSLSYVRRHRAKTFLTLLGVVVGVATYVAVVGARGSLLGGIRETVDRMAGKAQLQLTQEGGVPEELQEAIRERPGIRAQSPVIEQVVVPERSELGSLLVLGVDLLGDREMRDYGFEGEDADLDDPLLFLAQADSVAVARPLAERAGLKTGDVLVLKLPAGPRSVTIRGLLTPKGFAEAFGGNLVVMDVYAAQELFGRGRRFDRLEVRLEEGVTLEAATASLRAVVPPNVKVETPDRRSAQMERLVANFAAGFDVTSGFALGLGAFLIYNAFSVAVNRRRRDIGTLRALGATPRQVHALFLLEALALGLVGSILGVLAGVGLTRAALDVMRQGAEQVYGVTASSEARLTLPLVLQGLALGLLASLVGAFAPSRAAAAVSPTEAFAKGVHQAGGAWSGRRVAAGLALLAVTVALGTRPPVAGMPMILTIVALGACSALLLVGPVSHRLLALGAPLVARLFPVGGRLASDALLSSPRRSAGTVTAMTLALTFAVGIGGYIEATTSTLVRWMRDILTSDIYVRASANFARPDYRFAPEVKDDLLAVPGVRSVESYRAPRLEYRGETIVLASIDMEPMLDRTRHDWVEGSEEVARREVGRGASCTVSDNFARKFDMGVGDVVELPGARGPVRFPIAAVVKDYTSDRGTVFVDRRTFLAAFEDDRVDVFDVNLAPGVDEGEVRDAIRTKLQGRMPALVSTKREFVADVEKAIDAFYALMQVTLVLALSVGVLGIVTSLLISVVERTREIGLLKALGALGGQIRRSVALEALAISAAALLLSLPLGTLLALYVEKTVAVAFAGWSLPHETPWLLLGQLLAALPLLSAASAWVPARQAARTPVTEALEYE
ncbi:MAG TPA: FtsX-like permease family protein [Thermoanaerobaculia bacterium]|nr:FtsX-like permease family protein [Thermoanaerobaculia bacterium]